MNFGGTVKLSRVGIFLLLTILLIFFLYVFIDNSVTTGKTINLKHLLAASIYIAEEGGKSVRIKDSFNKKSKGKTREGANDVVTDADYRSHCLMYYNLKLNFPTITIVSEEVYPVEMCQRDNLIVNKRIAYSSKNDISSLSNLFVPSRDVIVWIDPLDATQEFTDHLTKYVTTMVCVTVKGEPVIGVIHQPFDKYLTTSWAWIQHGISANLKHTKMSNTKSDFDHPTVIVSRSHTGLVENILKKAFPGVNITLAGGAGYKILQLIEGKASAYIHSTEIKKWDICAGDAILKAVGGQLSTLHNGKIDYSRVDEEINRYGILASIANHEWFHEQLKPYYS